MNSKWLLAREALMNAAIARDKSPDRLCESLYYMNEKLVKNKVFKKFCENRTQMDKFVHNMSKKAFTV